MKRLVNEIAGLIFRGWRPYDGTAAPSVYDALRCPHAEASSRKRPCWFTRGDIFLCIGCDRKCCLSRPKGFQLPLPIKYPYNAGEPFVLTPQEMVRKRHTLTAHEAAYCLNINVQTVYRDVRVGKLVALKDKPIRIRAKEVEELMSEFDE